MEKNMFQTTNQYMYTGMRQSSEALPEVRSVRSTHKYY